MDWSEIHCTVVAWCNNMAIVSTGSKEPNSSWVQEKKYSWLKTFGSRTKLRVVRRDFPVLGV